MLCPVCNKNPLTGRQKTCSSGCRSALYRKQKRQQRDASQHAAEQATGAAVPHLRRSHLRSSPSRDAQTREWLVSVATERIIEAIQRHGHPPAQSMPPMRRVDMRDQVTSQAPKPAVGYRLVLPARHDGDAPKLLPKRSRARDVAWYSLSPFEYPDDIRLSDGCWYRIVWVDAQRQRIRMQPGESVPGLYYFVGPPLSATSHLVLDAPQPQTALDSQSSSTPAAASSPSSPQATPAIATARTTMPTVTSAATGQSNDDDDIAALAREFARAVKADSEFVVRQSLSKKQKEEPDGFVMVLPPPPTSPPPESWTKLLTSFPALTMDESLLLIEFVVHPELMMQIRYEERLAEAKASGQPAPREPTTLLDHEQRHHLHALFTGRMVRPHFWALCRAIFEYVRQHGIEVLAYLPVPIPPLPDAEQRWLETAIANLPKRTYMHYVCALQDALLSEQPLPVEPSVQLSSKERNRIRKGMQDLRAVMFFKRRAASAAS